MAGGLCDGQIATPGSCKASCGSSLLPVWVFSVAGEPIPHSHKGNPGSSFLTPPKGAKLIPRDLQTSPPPPEPPRLRPPSPWSCPGTSPKPLEGRARWACRERPRSSGNESADSGRAALAAFGGGSKTWTQKRGRLGKWEVRAKNLALALAR